MSYYSGMMRRIKRMVEKNQYPPTFDPYKWPFYKVNCYAYALDLRIGDIKESIFIPGRLSDKNEELYVWSQLDFKEKLERDLKFLGFSYRPNDTHLEEGEYRIALYYIPTPHDYPIGFHIVRQDKDGGWSHRTGWKGDVFNTGVVGDTPPNLEEEDPILFDVLIIKKRLD